MRNLVYRAGPKFLNVKFTISWKCNVSNLNIAINLGFCDIGTPEAPQEVNIGDAGSNHGSYTSTWNQNWNQSGTM